MPICARCQTWCPGSAQHCERCGGVLADERQPWPTEDSDDPVAVIEDVWGNAGVIAILPDLDIAPMELDEADVLADRFDAVRHRAAGRHAAPRSWLPASTTQVATALDLVHFRLMEEGGLTSEVWAAIRNVRAAIVDLQAFLPDDDAVAAEACATRQETADRERGRAGLERIRWAQAIVISMLRDDDRVLGAHVALEDVDITIGSAAGSLDAVDRYKEAQMGGIGGIVIFPLSLAAGLILGIAVGGFTLAAAVIGVMLAAASIYLGPAYGWAVGTMSSRMDRVALRMSNITALRIGRWMVTAFALTAYFGGPAALGLAIALACAWIGAP